MGETVLEVLSTARAVSPNTDRPRPVNNISIFFLQREFQEKFPSLSNLCV